MMEEVWRSDCVKFPSATHWAARATHRASAAHRVVSLCVNFLLRDALEGCGALGWLCDTLGQNTSLFPFLQKLQICSVHLCPSNSINLVIVNEHVFGVVCEDLNTKNQTLLSCLKNAPLGF